jgi:hypothetical protein
MDLTGYDHEHAFFAHEDPRYLICACGQYGVRTRDMIGQQAVRLIEPPTPALRLARDVRELDVCADRASMAQPA